MYLNSVEVPTEQESFSEQERFKQMEITFILRKNGGYTYA